MKKCIAILTLLLACQVGNSQNYSVDELFKEFSHTEKAEKVKLGKLMMGFAGMFTDTMGINAIEVYDFDSCEESVKQNLTAAIKKLKDPDYETMVAVNDEGSHTKVLVKIKKDTIRELVVVTTGDSHVLVRIKGKIKPEDLGDVTLKHGKGGSVSL